MPNPLVARLTTYFAVLLLPSAASAGTAIGTFTMPQNIDPPGVTFASANSPLGATGGDLTPTSGLNVHGRVPGSNGGCLDVTQVVLQFTYSGTDVDFTSQSAGTQAAWAVNKSHQGSFWTFVFTALPGSNAKTASAPINDCLGGNFSALINLQVPGDPTNSSIADVSVTAILTGQERAAKFPLLATSATPPKIWSPNGDSVQVTVSGVAAESHKTIDGSTLTFAVNDEYGIVSMGGPIPQANITPLGNGQYAYSFTLLLPAVRLGTDPDGRLYTITVGASDTLGTNTQSSVGVVVFHDQGT